MVQIIDMIQVLQAHECGDSTASESGDDSYALHPRRRTRCSSQSLSLHTYECEYAAETLATFCKEMVQLLGRSTGDFSESDGHLTWEHAENGTVIQMTLTSRMVRITGQRANVENLSARIAPLALASPLPWCAASLPELKQKHIELGSR
eukprot:CAMPEP_0194491594 /NCGR_PEP_ID=MMETSP0253-20130528/10421_1 /TAXON_ID=2966 /ORGANISM="Noctiluca scintillans" /LENGTH=148 /DNA_ID=CAMNT_0039332343 /DNA_START=45 /DNA_END=491 /DNA_ORIENTATION=-